jgi:hypothetical protein
MQKNVGNIDRIARFVLGAILVLIGLLVPMSSAVPQIILVLLGLVLIVTAALRFCPLYAALKFTGSR